MDHEEAWKLPFDRGKVKEMRYYKTTSKEDNAIFEVWFFKKYVPLRSVIGMNSPYGLIIKIDLKIPKM